MSSLSSGTYTITNFARGTLVGRNRHEDRSLQPKLVASLGSTGEVPHFQLEVQSDGIIIKANGAHTVKIDNMLFAALLPEPPAELWKITRPEGQEGDTIFIIETQKRDSGWIMPDDAPDTEVSVMPLIVFPSDPPKYPPNELWRIERVSNE